MKLLRRIDRWFREPAGFGFAIGLVALMLMASKCPVPPIPPLPLPTPTPYPGDPTPITPPTYPPPTATSTVAPTATATVEPTVTPTPGEFPAIGDITFLDDGKVGSWPETSKITKLDVSASRICIYHTMAGKWPQVGNPAVEGNPWVIAQSGGRWYATTYEFLGPGQTCKQVDTAIWGQYSQYSALKSWSPKRGELVGLMVSTQARLGVPHASRNERSNISWVRWP